jgi:alpha-tubulin suppressor-like RCC1 family protein
MRKFKRSISTLLAGAVFLSGLLGVITPTQKAEAATLNLTPSDFANTKFFSADRSLVIHENGSLYSWGASSNSNSYGQIGDGTLTNNGKPIPFKIPLPSPVKDVSGSADHAVALLTDGTVYGWGRGDNGQTGAGGNSNRWAPYLLTQLNGTKQIQGSNYANWAVKIDGSVWFWGANFEYAAGNNSTTNVLVPTQVPGISNVKKIGAGYNGAAIALKNDGSVWGWGTNSYGLMANGTTTPVKSPTQLAPSILTGITDIITTTQGTLAIAIKSDGTILHWGGGASYTGNPTSLGINMSGVKQIAMGREHAAILKNDGTVWTIGLNSFGALGNGNTTSSVKTPVLANITGAVEVAVSDGNTVVLKADGTVWSVGANTADGTWNTSTVFVKTKITDVVKLYGAPVYSKIHYVKKDGSLWSNASYSPVLVPRINLGTSTLTLGSKEVTPGALLFLGGRLWHVIGDNYLISKDNLTVMAYGSTYDSANTTSIAYYLNNTLYNSFSPEDKAYMQYKTWNMAYRANDVLYNSVGGYVGLLSTQEFNTAMGLPTTTDSYWLLNQDSSGSSYISYQSGGDIISTQSSSNTSYVRPVIKLKPEIVITGGAGTLGSPYVIGGTLTLNKPATLSVTNTSDRTATLEWAETAGVSGYNLYRDNTLVYSGTDLSFTDTGLTGNTSYVYSIVGLSGSVESAKTFAVATTLQTGSVTSPVNFRKISATETSINLGWSAVSGATGYKLSKGGVEIANIAGTSYNNLSLTADTTYSYSLVAYNATGKLSSPVTLTAKTLAVGEGGGGGAPGSGGTTPTTPTLSTNNFLSSLVVGGTPLNVAFNKNTLNYTSATPTAANSVIIKATSEDAGATIKVNGTQIASGVDSSSFSLIGGTNTFIVTVTAESGAVKSYVVTVTKALNGVNDLSSIVLEGASLNEQFDKNTLNYTANVSTSTQNVKFTLGSFSIYSTMEINGINVAQNVTSGYYPLKTGVNDFNIVVTAQNGTVKTYTVKVTRDGLSSNNKLLNVFMGSAQLTPAFSPEVTEYSTSVNASVDGLSILTFKDQENASVKVNGIPATSGIGFGPLPLQAGPNTIKIDVKAQDGSVKTYTFRVTRGNISDYLPDVSSPPTINFKPSKTTKTSVKVEWNAIAKADSYMVARNGGAPVTVTGATYFEDVNLTEDTDYTYTLVARNVLGDTIPLTTTAHTLGSAPAAPTGFATSHIFFDSVSFMWNIVAKATSYVVMRDDNKKVYEGDLTVMRDQTVTENTYYKYSVYAKNAYGVSEAVYLDQVYTPYAPVMTITHPVSAEGKITFEFEVISGAYEYHVNRNPHWAYTQNPDGTYAVNMDNAVTGETKSLGNVSITNGKLPFMEDGIPGGDLAYKLTAVVKNADGSTSTTPEKIIDVPAAPTPPTPPTDNGGTTPPTDPTTPPTDNGGTTPPTDNGGTPTTPPATGGDSGTPTTPPATGGGSGSGGSGGGSGGSGGGGGGGSTGGDTGTTTPPTPSETTPPATDDSGKGCLGGIDFTDIDKHWAKDVLKTLKKCGILNGYEDGSFKPDQGITRAEFVTMLVTALNAEAKGAQSIYTDVTPSDWFYTPVTVATKVGWIDGMGNGLFEPNAPITREQMFTILGRISVDLDEIYDGKQNKMPSSEMEKWLAKFSDKGVVSDWAKGPIADAIKADLVHGNPDGTLQPKKDSTRAEAATVINSLLTKTEAKKK